MDIQTRRQRVDIHLIGDTEPVIAGNKLPTKKQALKVLFYHMRHTGMVARESAQLVVQQVIFFWEKALLPVRRIDHCVDKLLALYIEQTTLQKSSKRLSNQAKEQKFVANLDTLFDISAQNIVNLVDSEGFEFLADQRNKREFFIWNMYQDNTNHDSSRRYCNNLPGNSIYRNNQLLERLRDLAIVPALRHRSGQPTYSQEPESSQQSSEEFEASPPSSESHFTPSGVRDYRKKDIRGNVNVMTAEVVRALDACSISYRKAVHIIAAIAPVLGYDINQLILNKSSFNEQRRRVREEMAEQVKKNFNDRELNAAVLHWDGSIIPESISCKKLDRVPIIVSDGGYSKLLAVPGLTDSKGITQADAIHNVLIDWGLIGKIKALCCDTTAANLGSKNGAAVLLEQMMETDILYLPCRHHIFEIILGSVFEIKLPGTSGPSVLLFKRFQEEWPNINKDEWQAISIENLNRTLKKKVDVVAASITVFLEDIQPRDDYKELLQLGLIFLGRMPLHQIKFYKPGAYHHARWMAKAIYCLKIYIFRNCFHLSRREEESLLDICIFVVFVYLNVWYTCPLAINSANNDLRFIKTLVEYQDVDVSAAEVALNKFRNHLWYLAPETVAMAFFDKSEPSDVKQKMVDALSDTNNDELAPPKRYCITKGNEIHGLASFQLDHFVDSRTQFFFKRFGIGTEFLKCPIDLWPENDQFLLGRKIVKTLLVVNDIAERNIHLAEQFLTGYTKDEIQAQYLLQVVTEYRKEFSKANKGIFLQRLPATT